jgi:hypothetical protein
MKAEYHVALSFAGEDRDYVDQVASHLRNKGVKVFYDRYEQVDLWGKDLYEHLSNVYRNKAFYTVMFISTHYAKKLWTQHERKNAQSRAFNERREYILPARFDDTEIPGILDTVGYLSLRHYSPEQLSEAICEKLVRTGVELLPQSAQAQVESIASQSTSQVEVTVKNIDESAVAKARILLVAQNGTYLESWTDENGRAVFDVMKRRMVTVFCAHIDYPALRVIEHDSGHDLVVTWRSKKGFGSFISVGGWDEINGFKGQFSPIHDTSDRLYVYAKNVSIENGQPQPVPFERGQPLHIEDANGQERQLTFVDVIGDVFLIEHKNL